MSEFPYDQLEVVAFNGTVTGPCGRATAIARDKRNGQLVEIPISGPDEPIVVSSRNRIGSLQSQQLSGTDERGVESSRNVIDPLQSLQRGGYLTQLEPLPAKKGMMALFVTAKFVEAFDHCHRPEDIAKKVKFKWQELPQDRLKEQDVQEQAWATCDAKDAIEGEMNEWGRALMDKATNELSILVSKRDESSELTQDQQSRCQDAERLAGLALYAARDKDLREDIFLRYGLAIRERNQGDRFENMYRLVFKPQFPHWDWETFGLRLEQYRDFLRIKNAWRGEDVNVKVKRIVEKLDRITSRLSSFFDKSKHVKECKWTAKQYRKLFSPPIKESDAERSASFGVDPHPRVDERILRLIPCLPEFYYIKMFYLWPGGYVLLRFLFERARQEMEHAEARGAAASKRH